MSTRYGRQPAKQIVLDRKLIITRISREIGVKVEHLSRTLDGKIRPRDEVREHLPKLLGVPLEQLFTAEVLAPRVWRATYVCPSCGHHFVVGGKK